MRRRGGAARLRMVRELRRWVAAGGDPGAETGFTLIELMVVLLIMAILLAIAIPTFLSVTNGAKKTATESDLTNALQSATALYTKTQTFPTTAGTPPKAEAKLVADMKATQTTITFLPTTTNQQPAKGKNSVVVINGNTGQLVGFFAEDDATGCWYAVDNQSSTTLTGVPPGDQFAGYKASHGSCATTLTSTSTKPDTSGWKPNFKTVTAVP